MISDHELLQRSARRRARYALHIAHSGPLFGLTAEGEFDPRTERNLATLQPQAQPVFRAAMRSWIARAALSNLTVQIISGTRTPEEQHALFLQRPKVTNADAWESNHNYGIACDLALFRGTAYLDDLIDGGMVTARFVHQCYTDLVQPGVAEGLTAGALWPSFPDEDHYELRPPFAAEMSESVMIAELHRRHLHDIPIFG